MLPRRGCNVAASPSSNELSLLCGQYGRSLNVSQKTLIVDIPVKDVRLNFKPYTEHNELNIHGWYLLIITSLQTHYINTSCLD